MIKRNFALGCLAACLFALPAFSTAVVLTTPVVSIDTVDWSQVGANLDSVAQNFSAISALGNAITGSFTALGGGLTSVVCDAMASFDCSWGLPPTGFQAGETLLWAEDPNYVGAGPVSLALTAKVGGLGAWVQMNAINEYTFKIDAYDDINQVFSHTYTSNVAGDPVFVGMQNDTANINRIVFTGMSCGQVFCDPQDFTLGTLQIYSASDVPEPATLPLAIAGLVGLGITRRKLTRKNQN